MATLTVPSAAPSALVSGLEPSRAELYQRFLATHPAYQGTLALDELRRRELPLLDEHGIVYLDYTGGGLHGRTQIARHAELLTGSVLGNPHSANPTSRLATEWVERARERVLGFFGASPEEWAVVFTANATQALKLVGESYPFETGDRLLLTFDNHNSVNGIREFDRAHGADTTYVPVLPPDLRIDEAVLERELARGGGAHRLFAYPAQSNFSGVQHPLSWIARARERGWDVLLDAAAFVPTNRLDLGRWQPDYVALSFYKMFGWPTGVGALLARREALEKLHRPWFAGGTITVASVAADRYCLAPGAEAFEDGTLNYAALPAVVFGLDFLESAGVDVVHTRVRCLTAWLLERLVAARHGNGRPLARIYGPTDARARGGAVAFNLYDRGGRAIDHREVERRAAKRGISLRTGCFCNPGAGECALGLSKPELDQCFESCQGRMSYDDFRRCIDAESTGAVRVSLGLASNFDDVEAFVAFARGFLE